MGRRRFGQGHLAGLRIEAPDIVSLFVGEPQNAIVIEHWSVRIDLGAIGWPKLGDRTSLRIELADVTSGYRGEPNVAIFVGDQSVRP